MIRKDLFVTLALAAMSAVTNAQTVDSGTCGNGVIWEITGVAPDYTLTIGWDGVGTGEMTNFAYYADPWYSQRANLKTLVINYGVTTIGNYAFRDCSSFTGNLTIPNSVTTIGNQAFRECSGFTGNLIIPNSVTTIGSMAFTGCSGFTGSLIIPNSVTTIGSFAFMYCSGFTGNLTIPPSVTSISSWAFNYCSGFTSITSLETTPPTLGADVFEDVSATIPILVPCGSESDYQTDAGWSYFTNYSFQHLMCAALEAQIDSLENDTAALNLQIAGLKNDTATLNLQIAGLENDTASCNQNTLALLAQIADLENDTILLNSIITDLQSDTFLLKIIIKDLQASLDSCLNGLLSTKSIHLDDEMLQVYPNPTNGQLHITYVGTGRAPSVQMYDVVGCAVEMRQWTGQWTGRAPSVQSEIVVDISHLAAGLYFLKVDGKTVKIVKQ